LDIKSIKDPLLTERYLGTWNGCCGRKGKGERDKTACKGESKAAIQAFRKEGVA